MLWYGYLYYILFNLILLTFIFSLLRLYLSTYVNHWFSIFILNRVFLSIVLFFFFISFTLLNYTIEISELIYFSNYNFSNSPNTNMTTNDLSYTVNYITNLNSSRLWSVNSNSLNMLQTYTYPFIYVFLVVTVLSIVYCLSYNVDDLVSFMFYCQLILLAGYALFFTDSIILFFLFYEFLLVPSFFILYKFAKTRRCVEAAYLMFFWTQFGALFLLFALLYVFFISQTSQFSRLSHTCYSTFEINYFFVCLLIGFGVKLPIWPFYGWLPKAHVEASTNFSIFLSGVLVKFAFFGLFKCLLTFQVEPTFIYVYPFLLVGMVDAIFKLFYQVDLKKLVAYSTVIEMHWLTICVVSGQSSLMMASFCMLISHALLSTNSFLLVDAVARRYKTRLLTEISGINYLCPKLFLSMLLNTLVFLGFPGSIFFVAEFLFFSFFLDFFPMLAFFLISFLYLIGPTFFFRSWLNVMFGFSYSFITTLPMDLSTREFTLFIGVIVLMYWLGISWQFFIY
jgi:NADH-quinone oxidoreductase subunit M